MRHWWIFYKDSGPPLGKKSTCWQKMVGKSSRLAIFNRIWTLNSCFLSNFELSPYIFCQFLLTMSSSIQVCIKIDVFVKICPKIWLAKNLAPLARSLAKATLFCKIFTSVMKLVCLKEEHCRNGKGRLTLIDNWWTNTAVWIINTNLRM